MRPTETKGLLTDHCRLSTSQVPGFCVQSGDPTGTGTGGESCLFSKLQRTCSLASHFIQASPSTASHSKMNRINDYVSIVVDYWPWPIQASETTMRVNSL